MQKYIIIMISVLVGMFVGSMDLKFDHLDKHCSTSDDSEPKYLIDNLLCNFISPTNYQGILFPLDMTPRMKDNLIVILSVLAAMGWFGCGYFLAKLILFAEEHIDELDIQTPSGEPDYTPLDILSAESQKIVQEKSVPRSNLSEDHLHSRTPPRLSPSKREPVVGSLYHDEQDIIEFIKKKNFIKSDDE
jgi:hypothetical protein